MPYPPYVLTRAVTVGGAMTLEGASTLRMILTLKSSRPLVWDATGYRFESHTLSTPPSEPGGEVALTLPRTDVAGWRDGRTGAVIDVSAPDSHTHTYTGALTFLTADGKATSIPAVSIGPFVLPEGDGSPVDLDKTVPVGTVAGQALAVPDTWSALVAAAEQAAQDAADALASIGAAEVPATPSTVPLRTAAGTIKTAAPVEDDDAVSLGSAPAVVDGTLGVRAISGQERLWLDDYAAQRRESPGLVAAMSPLTVRPAPATVTIGGSGDIAGKTRIPYFKTVTVSTTSGSAAVVATAGTFDAGDVGKPIATTSGALAAANTIASVEDSTHATLSVAATGTTSAPMTIANVEAGNFTRLGTEPLVQATTSTGIVGTSAVRTRGASPRFVPPTITVTGIFTGQTFAVYGPGQSSGTGRVHVYVDEGFGWEAAAESAASQPASSSACAVIYDLGSVKTRRVRIEMSNLFGFQGIYLWSPTDTWVPDPNATAASAVYIGDSYVESGLGGATAPQDKGRSVAAVSAKLLGYRGFYNLGQSGTGWVNPGTGVRADNAKIADRVPDVLTRTPDVVHILAGTNDAAAPVGDVAAEVTATLAALRAGAPGVRIYVTGPWCVANPTTFAGLVERAAAIEAACITAGVPCVNPATGRIVGQSGTLLDESGRWLPADSPYLTPDGIHVTTAGAAYLGYRHAAAIARIEQERRYPA